MLLASDIQPYVNLVTWPVVALAGGIVFMPAVYLIAFRMRRFSAFGASAELSREEARAIEVEAEQELEERVDARAGSHGDDAHEELDDITNAPAGAREQMYKNVVEAQLALSAIVRSIAAPLGGERSLKAFKRNLDIIRAAKLLPKAEVDRLVDLYERRFAFRRDPASLTRDSYRSYMRSARRTANRLPKKLGGTFPVGATSDGERPN